MRLFLKACTNIFNSISSPLTIHFWRFNICLDIVISSKIFGTTCHRINKQEKITLSL